MKANELMVGDFVMMGRKNYRCANICGHTNDVLLDNGVITNVGNLNPIPLTPEILEKNGIVYDYDETECVADYTYVNIKGYQFHDDDNGVLIDYCNGHIKIINDCIGTIDMDINYVHELQHALRLLNIEKEIEL